MRALTVLAAALLAGASAASAAPTVYGISFIGTEVYVEQPDGPFAQKRDFTGTFTFDTATNQLLALNTEIALPGRDFTSASVALFSAAQPCDLQCFIGALEGGSFSLSYTTGASSITFASPLSGTATLPGLLTGPRPISVDGIIRVNGAIPEPGSWLMMLLGFGAVGATMRRRRPISAAWRLKSA